MTNMLWKAKDRHLSALAILLSITTLASVFIPKVVLAQGEAPGFRPGRIEQPAPPEIKPEPKIELQIPEGASALREKLEKIKLLLKNIKITGSSVYSEEDLKQLYQHLIGQEITLAEIFTLEEKITQKYRENGYILSRAVIPEQRISEGVVQIQVVEGYIKHVTIQGGDDVKPLMESYLNKLLDSKPLKVTDLERYLLLVNDLPGITAKSVIRPAAGDPGATEIVVLTERDKVSGLASYDNYGSNYSGPEKGTVSASLNSVAGFGEKLTVDLIRAIPDRELDYKKLAVSLPVGAEGAVVNMNTSYGPSEPGDDLRVLQVKSWSTAYAISASYPAIRSRMSNLTLETGYDYKKNSTYLLGDKFTEDRIPAIYFKGLYDFIDRYYGTNMITLTVRKGLDGMGMISSTPEGDLKATRIQGRPTFTVFSGDLRRVQSLHKIASGLNLVMSGFWQYTNEPVYSAEEFGVGGRVYGRGYDLGEILGDRGGAITTEIQYDNTLFKKKLSYQLYSFFDMGKVWNIDDKDRQTINERPSLESTGLGTRLKWNEYLALNAEIAKPLRRFPATQYNRDPRYFLGVEFTF